MNDGRRSKQLSAIVFAWLLVTSIVFATVPIAANSTEGSLTDPSTSIAIVESETVTIAGQVYGLHGEPAANDTVAAFGDGEDGEGGPPIDVTLTDEAGNYSLELPKDGPYSIAYFQGDIVESQEGTYVVNQTVVPPRDGSPDLYGVETVDATADRDLGRLSLPDGYLFDPQVVDQNGTAIENAIVLIEHENAATNGTAARTWETDAEGRINSDGNETGVELNGTIRVGAFLVESVDGEEIVTESTFESFVVTGPSEPTIVLGEEETERDGDGEFVDAPDDDRVVSGVLVADPTVAYARFTDVTFSVENATGFEDGDFYSWSFDDPNPVDYGFHETIHPQNATTYVYGGTGERVASVTAYDDYEQLLLFDEIPITVYEPASGEIVADNSSPIPGENVTFSVTNVVLNVSTNVSHYNWRFGDGSGVERTDHPNDEIVHAFEGPGTYEVSVYAYDESGTYLFDDFLTVTVSATADLEATPSVADVNVTEVEFTVTNVTEGVDPAFYEWQFGDGTFDSSDNETVAHVYDQLLGETTISVTAYSDDELPLFEAETTVDVVDRIPPVARASANDTAVIGEPFEIDASASSDNHRIVSYAFTTDDGETVGTTEPVGEVTFSTPGERTVTVTVTDESGNANETTLDVFVKELPDLAVRIDADETQNLNDGPATVALTVYNNGTNDAADVGVRLDASIRTSWYRTAETSFTESVGDLAPGASETIVVDITEWADGNVTGSRTQVDLTATVDPEGEIEESDETNNVDRASTHVGFSDIVAYVSTSRMTLTDEDADVRLLFRNRGSLRSPSHTAEVDFGDGTPNETVQIPELDRYQSHSTTLQHTFDETGRNVVTVEVIDDPVVAGNVHSYWTRTVDYSLDLQYVRSPSEVERDETFRVRAGGSSNFPSDTSATIELPDGLALAEGESETITRTGTTRFYPTWSVTALEEREDEPYQINVTVNARDEVENGSTTTTVVTPKERVRDSSSVVISDSGSETTTLDVRGETTFEHDLDVAVQLGAEGRTLSGLDYLFNYPHHCVEQTVSPMLTALNTDQYYRVNSPPEQGGYDQDRVNESVRRGAERMVTGANAQHDNGSWSMYGNDPEGNVYYTAYGLFGMSSVAADPVQSARPEVSAELAQMDLDETVLWLESRQADDGRLANDKHYFDDDAAMTGFVLVAIDRGGPYDEASTAAAERINENATAYLVDAQREDGSWGERRSDAMSTSLAVWGLAVAGADTPEAEAALEDGVDWLVANQNSDGAWQESRTASWRATGVASETTGYAVLALNATGLPADNETIVGGTTFLVQTYDDRGSWGYTRASSVAIESLLALGVEGTNPSQTVTVTFGNETASELVIEEFAVDETEPIQTVSLTDEQLEVLRNAAGPIEVTVEADGTGQLVVGFENDQLVDRHEYEANTGGVQG